MQYLRPWSLADAADLAAIISNPNILRNLRDGIPYPYTPDQGEAFLRGTLDAPQDSQYAWAICAEGRVVGSLALFRKENVHRRTAELGYFLAVDCWGKGIVTAAVQEACRYIFAETDIVRIFAEPFSYNTGSCRVLEKAGFTLEGVLRKNAMKDGKILDMPLYSLIRE